MYDVICVGGGIAGSATAAFLAREGLKVLILDKAEFPRHKVCGEGILPSGVVVLRKLGLKLPEASIVRGLVFRVGDREARLPFSCGPGWAVRRWILDHALLCHARSMGADFRQERACRVEPGRVFTDRSRYEGRWLVGADGARSVFHRSFGIRVRRPTSRVGISLHVRGLPVPADWVEVTFFRGGEIYAAPVDGGLTLVSLLLDRYRSPWDVLRDVLRERASRAVLEGPILSSAPLERNVDRCAGASWLLVGDSAGTLDPIIGEGMSIALAGAEAAAHTIVGKKSVEAFVRETTQIRRSFKRWTTLMLLAARHRWLARRLLRWGPTLMRWAVKNELG